MLHPVQQFLINFFWLHRRTGFRQDRVIKPSTRDWNYLDAIFVVRNSVRRNGLFPGGETLILGILDTLSADSRLVPKERGTCENPEILRKMR
jgi:hypothetical protein